MIPILSEGLGTSAKFAFVLSPLLIHQVAPRTRFGLGASKATLRTPVRFAFDVVGEPKLPRRVNIALVPDTVANKTSALEIIDRGDIAWSPMVDRGNDLYEYFWVPLHTKGYVPVVVAWVDEVDRLVNLAQRKLAIAESAELELTDIAMQLERQVNDPTLSGWPTFGVGGHLANLDVKALKELRFTELEYLCGALRDADLDALSRLELLGAAAVNPLVHLPTRLDLACVFVGEAVWVERPLAGSSSWYELFPRSLGGFRGVHSQLDRIAALGFDVLYLPPIHPIGTSARKGRNNSLVANSDDVGSPWAIGNAHGGHCAVDPSLGSEEDFDALLAGAAELGLEIALDIALQCSPDHPWVKEHPDWFHVRADKSIAFAENPPKKYQDIYPINFYVDDPVSAEALWRSVYGIFVHWIERGVKVFRVDNPHTKPIAFWRWICDRLRDEHPEVILLAEAFTMPKLMYLLGELGFSQSYTYFTWRTTKEELATYAEELSREPAISTLRPNFWPNTPDILADPLRGGNRAAFMVRATLAATMAASWGIYSGFEFCENVPFSAQSEEYFDSEKYQLKYRDFSVPAPLDPYVALLNDFRRNHPCIAYQPGFRHVASDSEDILAYLRFRPDSSDSVLVVVNLRSDAVVECQLELWAIREQLGLSGVVDVRDRVSGEFYRWDGQRAYVRLDPAVRVAHLLEFGAQE